MLATALRDRLRVQVQRTMPTTVQVQRASSTRDADGNIAVTWSTIATVAGRVDKDDRARPSELVQGEQRTSEQTWTVALPAGTDVTAKDRLLAGGVTYEVLGVRQPMSFEVERRCDCVVVG